MQAYFLKYPNLVLWWPYQRLISEFPRYMKILSIQETIVLMFITLSWLHCSPKVWSQWLRLGHLGKGLVTWAKVCSLGPRFGNLGQGLVTWANVWSLWPKCGHLG